MYKTYCKKSFSKMFMFRVFIVVVAASLGMMTPKSFAAEKF